MCVSVSVTLESGNVRGFEQTAVVLALSDPAPLPNAFNLGAELLDVFTSNPDDFGCSTVPADVEESVSALVGTEM